MAESKLGTEEQPDQGSRQAAAPPSPSPSSSPSVEEVKASPSEEEVKDDTLHWAAPRDASGTPGDGQWTSPDPEEGDEDCIDWLDFRGVLPGVQGDGQQLDAIFFGLQPRAISRLVMECTPLIIITAVLSLVSLGFLTLYFFFVLRWPSDQSELPQGYASWTSCRTDAARPAVSALGHVFPFNKARALISLPKIFEVAILVALMGGVISRWQVRATCVNLIGVFFLAVVAVPVYTRADQMGMRALPTMFDPLFTFAMLIVLVVTNALIVIRPRQASTGAVANHPKLGFFAAMMLMFGTNAVLVNLLAVMARSDANPSLVVCASLVFVRACSFFARCIFRSLSLPISACFVVLFAYEVSMVLSLRRYWLALPELSDVAIAAVVSAVLELICNTLSTVYAVHSYRALMSKGRPELARAQLSISFTALVCDLIAEHVALHGSLGYNLFLDPRILTIDMQLDKEMAVEAWGVSFIVELAVDMVFIVPLICFLPVSPNKLWRKRLRSLPVCLCMLCTCAHCHLIGLHAYLDKARYFCE